MQSNEECRAHSLSRTPCSSMWLSNKVAWGLLGDHDESLCRMSAPQYLPFAGWRWAMANILVGWPPADIAAANMRVPVSIKGQSAINIPVCHVVWQISLSLLLFLECPLVETVRVSNRRLVYGGIKPPCMKRVTGCALVFERTPSLVPQGKLIYFRIS